MPSRMRRTRIAPDGQRNCWISASKSTRTSQLARTNNTVEVVIKTRNEARDGLQSFGRDINEATRGIRVFTGSVLSEINPALGQMVQSLSLVGREVRNVGFALGALGITGAVAAVGLTKLIENFNAATTRAIDLRIALESLNSGSVRSQLDATAKTLEQFDK